MNLSPRERRIAIVMLIAIGIAALYYVADSLYFSTVAELNTKIDETSGKLNNAYNLETRRRNANETWKALLAGGLKSDVESADSQLGHALEKWTHEAKLNFSSIKPERAPIKKNEFYEINSAISGTGPQSAVVQLLWRAETASIPIRITQMTLNTKDSGKGDGADELQVSLGVSTLSQNPDADKPAAGRPGASPGERGRS